MKLHFAVFFKMGSIFEFFFFLKRKNMDTKKKMPKTIGKLRFLNYFQNLYKAEKV